MNEYIFLYNGQVTAGQSNGDKVTDLNPVLAVVNTNGEEVSQDLAIRCEAGFQTYGDCTLSLTGANSNLWAFEIDGVKKAWGESAVIADVSTTNKIIKVYTKAEASEKPQTDTSVSISLDAVIQAV